jgi:hypothetical protein
VKLIFIKINLSLAGAGVNQAAGRQLDLNVLDNVGSLASHNPICLQGLLRGYLSLVRNKGGLIAISQVYITFAWVQKAQWSAAAFALRIIFVLEKMPLS